MTSWDELPDENKRALGFDFVVGSEGEEVALNHLALRGFVVSASVGGSTQTVGC